MKTILINVAALVCAVLLLGGTVVYSAGELPVVMTTTSKEEKTATDDFLQGDDLLIADLLAGEFQEDNKQPESFNTYEYTATPSSEKPKSEPAKSEPAKSEPTKSEPPQSQQTPLGSAVESKPVSSEAVSSEVSSEPESEEESIPEVVPPSGDYAEILDMLAGAVQREIVGTNTNPQPKYYEAYKAQAVACHSYMEYHKEKNGSYPTMSYSTPTQQTLNLVSEVLNELIYYNGSVINASYHAASGGYTQSAVYVWYNPIPYLVGVESAYDDYSQQSVISVSEVENKLLSSGISVSGDPSTWFDLGSAVLTDGGFIEYISICGQQVKGRTLRENILGASLLKSPKITDISVSGDSFTFSTKGYGHGAGLSQQGALGYAANDGWGYKQILTHYYQGTQVQ